MHLCTINYAYHLDPHFKIHKLGSMKIFACNYYVYSSEKLFNVDQHSKIQHNKFVIKSFACKYYGYSTERT